MSSSIHYTRKAITSNIFIREKILKKKNAFFKEDISFWGDVISMKGFVSFVEK